MRRQDWLTVVLSCLALALGGYLLQTRFVAAGPMTPTPLPTLPPAPATPLPEGGRRVAFVDASTAWDWDASACGPALQIYLAPYPVRALHVRLEDLAPDPTLRPTMGVAYPDLADPRALVRAYCDPARDEGLSCRLAVQQGEPGPALDVAASAALGYAIWDVYRDRSREAWAREEARGWQWSRFEPLIHAAGGEGWQSACLTLSAADGS